LHEETEEKKTTNPLPKGSLSILHVNTSSLTSAPHRHGNTGYTENPKEGNSTLAITAFQELGIVVGEVCRLRLFQE
jgi:hypothetical protein